MGWVQKKKDLDRTYKAVFHSLWLGHQYQNRLFSSISELLLPLPPKAGSRGSYAGQTVSTQLPILGEQFRNVNIAPQVITGVRAEVQNSWLESRAEAGWTCWKRPKAFVQPCRWKQEPFKRKLRESKNSDLPVKLNFCVHTHKGKEK